MSQFKNFMVDLKKYIKLKGLVHQDHVAIQILCPKESHEVEELLIVYKRCEP